MLFVAGPAIAEALDPTGAQWLWIMDIYGFVMASLLITMGSLGDRIGRKRLLLIGAALFGAASAVIAFAPTPETLIAARAALGLGGATLAPSTLSLIRDLFADERRRLRAIGLWTIAFTGGAVAGPIVGGLLLERFWWGTVFLINVPVMVLLLTAAPFLIPESRNPSHARFDLTGAAASLVTVLALVYAMKHTAEHGPDFAAALSAAIGLASAAGFAVRQKHAEHPLIDAGLFRSRAFGAAVAANTIAALAAAGLGLLAFTYMQAVHGLSPLQAALAALPTFAGTMAGATAAGALSGRFAQGPLLVSGLLVSAAGFGVIALTAAGGGLGVFIGGYTVLTLGIGVTGTIANSLILNTASAERAGAASGISETGAELGAALGIATLGTVATAVYRNTMAAEDVAPAARESMAGALSLGPGPHLAAAAEAFGAGLSATALAGAAGLVVTSVLVAVAVRSRHRAPATRRGAGFWR
ncbi:MFS transporter [Sinosporangium siamense]|uniref:MFS transporter n=1 Tax=Sinosporangium siamense TaxID=1367973 RepID=A0A919RP81_9ACTN|nr:MFS transporter [Sinosporangium siamense]